MPAHDPSAARAVPRRVVGWRLWPRQRRRGPGPGDQPLSGRGEADMTDAADGRLDVHSPAGEGTRLEAHIPIEAGSLVAEASEIRARPVHPLPPMEPRS